MNVYNLSGCHDTILIREFCHVVCGLKSLYRAYCLVRHCALER